MAMELMRPSANRRRGITLVELVASTAVSAVLLGGIGASVMLAGWAVPSRATAAGAVVEAEQAISRMAADLAVATSVPTRAAMEMEFTVADRNGDNNSERFGYKWSGTVGTPLRVSENLSLPAVLVPKVYDFQLQYLTATAESRIYLYGVRIRLRTSEVTASVVETTVFLLNAPEVAPILEGEPDAL